jgi:predicted phosphodiesterase
MSDSYERIGVFGGVYNNYIALKKVLSLYESIGVQDVFCLGDLGAFGPHPDRVFPPLVDNDVKVVQGNYDYAIGNDLEDCQCGYTDPEDNYYAQLSYDYTYENTSDHWKDWMAGLPEERRVKLGDYDVLMCHGSPRKTNEFLWESTTPDHFLHELFEEYDADVILATHTGMHWSRSLEGDRHFVNVGVLGRPPNDGKTHVWTTLLQVEDGQFSVEFIPVNYDYQRLADEMRDEDIPEEFIETIETGWWTTCLEILPAKERAIGKY